MPQRGLSSDATVSVLEAVRCEGGEANLLACSHSGVGQYECGSAGVAGVQCGGMYELFI